MENGSREALAASFASVFETLGLMWAESADESDLPTPAGACKIARIEFAGPVSGVLSMAVTMAMARELASNMLGIDAGGHEAIQGAEDALREILNVACGQMLTRCYGEEPVFDLTPPVTRDISAAEWQSLLGDGKTMPLRVDDHPVLVMVDAS